MKTSHIKIISTCGLAAMCLILVGHVSVRAQDATAGATNSQAANLSTNVPPPSAAVPADSANPSTNTAAATPAAVAPAAAPAASTIEVAGTPAAEPAALAPGVVIPLIAMDDLPLTDAIKNLAREAGLNYILDPRVSFGPPGPDGKAPVPNISIRWENVTAEGALNTLLTTYGLQLIKDPNDAIARVTVKDPSAPEPLESKIIQLKYASPTNILGSIQTALIDKRSRITTDVRTSQLVLLATKKEMDAVENMVARLDVPNRQVLIEAYLLETSAEPSSMKGIDWTGTLQGQHVAFGNNLQQNPPATSINNTLSQSLPNLLFDTSKGFNPATGFLDADGVNAVFSFLNTDSDARIISAPRTVTLDNEPTMLEVTRATPIINVTAGTVQTTGGSQITYTNLGIILHVTPRISANSFVNLLVIPEVSRIFDTVTKTIDGETSQADEYDIRRMETRVMIPSGNTLVLGGLVQDEISTASTKVPILGDIPGLGFAFRSESKTRQKNNLLIFITPTIVSDSDFQPTKSTFLQNPLNTTQEKDWSAWDSAKPAKLFHHDSDTNEVY